MRARLPELGPAAVLAVDPPAGAAPAAAMSLPGVATTRRRLLAGGAVVAAGLALPAGAGALTRRRLAPLGRAGDLGRPNPAQAAALRVLGRQVMRLPDSLPDSSKPAGTDTMPQIEHVVVVMMENHSYDNLLGMLGRGPFQIPRGDGFTLAPDGHPANANPRPGGGSLRAYRMPSTCQRFSTGGPSQEWTQSHIQYAHGTNQGFVASASGAASMGYWDGGHLPFLHSLAATFPLGDRYFCSVLGQTDPNRRYLLAATSAGMTDDVPDPQQDLSLALPATNGTILNRLSDAGVSWYEYAAQNGPTNVTMNLFPDEDSAYYLGGKVKPMTQFFTDAAAGTLPSVSVLDENFGTQSEENPQNIIVGDAWLASVIQAVGASPKWRQTMVIVTYDEHGGYYDHVPPPVALAPDDIPPILQNGESPYDGFRRYGFRVPAIVVSPYAKANFVSHVVHDHTSILAFLERKFNLPAMTYRDANANDLTDFLDLGAMAAQRPTFPELPPLAAPGADAATLACSTAAPVTLPVPEGPALPLELRFGPATPAPARRALTVALSASRAVRGPLRVTLSRDGQVIASARVPALGPRPREVVLRHGRRAPGPGRYVVRVHAGPTALGQAVRWLR
ncbi:MAG TPA: alkaline phosphatase family protein [Solirubrobacteraceae bacterium]|nr:alkaline phosphatase family protein [Solirubrobacteraceae bacterium]